MDREEFNERRKYHEMQKEKALLKRNSVSTFTAVTAAISGLVIILIKDVFYNSFNNTISTAIIVLGGVWLAGGVGMLLFRYLQSGNRVQNNYGERDLRLQIEIEDLRLELIKLKKKTGISDDNDNLNDAINKIIDTTITDDFLQSKIETKYSDKVIDQSKLNKLYDDIKNLNYRIDGEINRLRRSANLNLVIGTLTTGLAVLALSYEIFMKDVNFGDSVSLLSHYLPRISLVVFIEIFAFFFLKLYKANLEDIKYFNNEKTNIDFKIISLNTALQQGNDSLIKLIIEELIKTERNFKLGKGESTVELERLRNESENNKNLSQLLTKLSDKL